MTDTGAAPFAAWIAALDARHLATLTPSEVARALRALSSCYVERRDKLAGGQALATAGKRAAFALFYAPIHFLLTQQMVRALAPAPARVTDLLDLGCGTGRLAPPGGSTARLPSLGRTGTRGRSRKRTGPTVSSESAAARSRAMSAPP
jgi:hypothetical protein